MTDKPNSLIPAPRGYADWLFDLKGRIHTAQQRAALAVNRGSCSGNAAATFWRGRPNRVGVPR